MKAILKHFAALPALLALTAPVAAQENQRRAGGLEPLESGEMKATIVPLNKPPEEGTRAYQRWLDEQRRWFREENYIYYYDPEYLRFNEDRSRGLTPFQQDFRDSLMDQMRGTAEQFR